MTHYFINMVLAFYGYYVNPDPLEKFTNNAILCRFASKGEAKVIKAALEKDYLASRQHIS